MDAIQSLFWGVDVGVDVWGKPLSGESVAPGGGVCVLINDWIDGGVELFTTDSCEILVSGWVNGIFLLLTIFLFVLVITTSQTGS